MKSSPSLARFLGPSEAKSTKSSIYQLPPLVHVGRWLTLMTFFETHDYLTSREDHDDGKRDFWPNVGVTGRVYPQPRGNHAVPSLRPRELPESDTDVADRAIS